MHNRTAVKSDLEKTLEALFTKLEEEKIITFDPEQKKELMSKIVEELVDNKVHLTTQDLNNKNVQNKLLNCITTLALGKTAEFDSMIQVLGTNEKNEPSPELDNKLKTDLFVLNALDGILNNNNENKIALTPDMKKDLKKELEPDSSKLDKKIDKDILEKQLDDTLRNLFGGDNPTISGEIQFPILGPIVGNLMSLANQSTPDPNAVSQMVQSITYSGKQDYLGMENTTKMLDQADGVNLTFPPTPSP